MRPPRRPRLEVADIVREHGQAYRRAHVLDAQQAHVLSAIEHCRTAALGGHLYVCLECGHSEPSYNSCRNRHCPKCQALAQARWIAGRMQRLLPVSYFHVVFTLPAELRPIARGNRRLVFDMLLGAAGQTLLELGRDPKRLGAELGVTTVLHTWTRELVFHPHAHCIVTGGGLAPDGDRWVHAPKDYLFSVHAMGALLRGKMLAALREAHRRAEIVLPQRRGEPLDPEAFDRLLARLYRVNWVAYCKRPFGGPEQVIRYLGRYTHRVGISNERLVSMDEGKVTFRTKAGKSILLEADEFLRRLLEHVLPPHFVKIRHYGILASGKASAKLGRARELLTLHSPGITAPASADTHPMVANDLTLDWRALLQRMTGIDPRRCPRCGATHRVRCPLPSARARPPPLKAA